MFRKALSKLILWAITDPKSGGLTIEAKKLLANTGISSNKASSSFEEAYQKSMREIKAFCDDPSNNYEYLGGLMMCHKDELEE
jgi:hypothetical protein